VKKVDYYAMNQPWKMPKWLGFTIGGIFGSIAIGSAILIVQLTKSPEAPKPAVAAAVAAPVAQDQATPAPAQAQDDAQQAPARPERTVVAHSRHAKKHDKHAAKGMKMASAKPVISDAKAHAILARHQTKTTRANKDALDKLLGL
jgi:hypothetical protein